MSVRARNFAGSAFIITTLLGYWLGFAPEPAAMGAIIGYVFAVALWRDPQRDVLLRHVNEMERELEDGRTRRDVERSKQAVVDTRMVRR